jgi:hypothetical protein
MVKTTMQCAGKHAVLVDHCGTRSCARGELWPLEGAVSAAITSASFARLPQCFRSTIIGVHGMAMTSSCMCRFASCRQVGATVRWLQCLNANHLTIIFDCTMASALWLLVSGLALLTCRQGCYA